MFKSIQYGFIFTFFLIQSMIFANHDVEPILINVGGSSYVDGNANTWSDDQFYNTGQTFTNPVEILNTDNDALYQTERWDASSGDELTYEIPLPSNGIYEVILHFAEIFPLVNVGDRVFDIQIENELVLDDFDILAEVDLYTPITKTFEVEVFDEILHIQLIHQSQNPKLSAIEINLIEESAEPGHLAHSSAGDDQEIYDLDGDGSESIHLDGSGSHTHKFGAEIISWIWKEGDTVLANGEIVDVDLDVGVHDITLYVEDDFNNQANDSLVIDVQTPDCVTGLISYYYDYSESGISEMPSSWSSQPDYGSIIDSVDLELSNGTFSDTSFLTNFSVQYSGMIQIESTGSYTFSLESSDGSKLYVDDILIVNNDGIHDVQKVSGVVELEAGLHHILIQYYNQDANPYLKLYWDPLGSGEVIVPSDSLCHDISAVLPVLHSIDPSFGPLTGLNTVTLSGFGFVFDANQTTVHFGSETLSGADINIVDSQTIEVTAPAGDDAVSVYIETENGTSRVQPYVYSVDAPPAIIFNSGYLSSLNIIGPTSLTFGPDHKLYVGTQLGEVWKITLNDNYQVIDSVVSSIIQDQSEEFRSILGIAIHPLDDSENPEVYVSSSFLFHAGTAKYNGKISKLSGENLDVMEDIITGLPVSDHDHGINGLDFGINGELYFMVGGNTNAGVAYDEPGSLDEYYFGGATLVAHLERDSFDGLITYDVDEFPLSGFDIEVYAPGMRSAYDLLYHSNGYLYGTDNGPNFDFGAASNGCDDQLDDPEADDEVNIIYKDMYYGHPNRLRGQTDDRQCYYKGPTEPSTDDYLSPMAILPASSNGIIEFKSNDFEGQLKDHLIVGKWLGPLYDMVLSSDGTEILSYHILVSNGGLDVTQGPDGTLWVAQQQNNRIVYHKPDNPVSDNLKINSVFPVRGPVDGIRQVTLYGNAFDATTEVTFDGNPANVISWTANQLICEPPLGAYPGAVDIEVSNDTETDTLTNAYIYMNTKTGNWAKKSYLPASVGELSAATVGGFLYVMNGHTSNNYNKKLYRYDPSSDTWQTLSGQNVGQYTHHASCEVVDEKIYIFGGVIGLNESESNQMIIFDPSTQTWSLGQPLVVNAQNYGVGAATSGVIDGKIYIAGGVHDDATVDTFFRYDPLTDSWETLPPMSQAVNHAAGVAFDGKFYVFGGRCCGGNYTSDGTGLVQVFDPVANTWEDQNFAPMPTARSGMAHAVVLSDEIILIGGEGSGPSDGTFFQVEAYNPSRNQWRSLKDMPTARHGIYPIVIDDQIHVVGGGTQEGFSYTNVHEVFSYEDLADTDLPELSIDPNPLVFPDTPLGESSQVTVTLSNLGGSDLNISSLIVSGSHLSDFNSSDIRLNYTILPGDSKQFTGTFSPNEPGLREALVQFVTNSSDGIVELPVEGEATFDLDPSHILINCGGISFEDSLGQLWIADAYFNTGNAFTLDSVDVAGTVDDVIYQSQRWDSDAGNELAYSFPVPNGNYQVKLHFAEIYASAFSSGARVFDIYINGILVEDNYDIYADVGSNYAAIKTYDVIVDGEIINIQLLHETDNPTIAGVEIVAVD